MTKISVIQGDITQVETDAIVNAANSSLLGGGGVDGAIHRKGGPEILAACRAIRAKQGGCATGAAVITTAGDLPSNFVIHTVGPVWTADREKIETELLSSCYLRSLELAIENDIKTIAFPNISTGVYRFPKALAAQTAISTVQDFLARNDSFDEVIFVCFDLENFNLYQSLIDL